jgi:GH24 family phage-related lysozyme (muramidase)
MDDQDKLNGAIQDLSHTINAALGSQTEVLKMMATHMGVDQKKMQAGLDDLGKNAMGAGSAAQSLAAGARKADEAQAQFKDGLSKSASGLGQFATALLDSTKSFSKYNGALTTFGDSAKQMGEALGGIGSVVGNVVKGMTMVGAAALKQADSVTKAYDDLAKVGGAGGITTKELMDMGHGVGLASKDLDKLTGVLKTNSQALASLGGDVGTGSKMFGQMAAVGTDTIAKYTKLGVSQEDLLKTQGDYLALQSASGVNLKNQAKDQKALQQASLEYEDNLLALSKITGDDVESIKKKQKEAAMAVEWQIAQHNSEKKEADLRKEGTKESIAQADAIKKEREARQAGMNEMVALNDHAAKGMREFLTTGTATSEEAQELIQKGLGGAMQEYKDTLAKGGDPKEAAAKFTDEYNKATLATVEKMGTAISLNPSLQKKMIGDADNLNKVLRQSTGSIADERKKSGEQVEAQKSSHDDALESREKLTKAEITASVALDDWLSKVNPLMGGSATAFIALSAAVGGATMALGKMTGAGALAGGKGGGLLDELGGVAGKAGKFGKIGKLLTGGVGGLLGGMALDYAGDKLKENGHEKLGAGADIASSAASGAGMGAMLGPMGALAGGAIGGAYGLYKNWGTLTGSADKTAAAPAAAAPAAAAPAAAAPAAAAPAAAAPAASKSPAASVPGGAPPAPTVAPMATASKSDSGGTGDKSGSAALPPTGAGPGRGQGGAGMTEDQIKDMIKSHEGVVNKPYQDSKGLWTVGVGHLIGDGHSLPDEWNRTFSKEEVDKLFDEDYKHHRNAAEQIPGFGKLDATGQGALTDMTFNMGPSWIKKWPNLQKQLLAGDMAGVADNLSGSDWAKQVKSRAKDIIGMLSSSKMSARDGGVFNGPESGYLVALHGNETVVPNVSGVGDMSKGEPASKQELSSAMNMMGSSPMDSSSDMSDGFEMMAKLLSEIDDKFDKLIDAVQQGNGTQAKILKYSKA